MSLISAFWVSKNLRTDRPQYDLGFHFCLQNKKEVNYCKNFPIWKGEQYHVWLSQDKNDMFKIKIVGENPIDGDEIEFKNPVKDFDDVTAYVSDPWHPAFSGCLLNFQVSKLE